MSVATVHDKSPTDLAFAIFAFIAIASWQMR